MSHILYCLYVVLGVGLWWGEGGWSGGEGWLVVSLGVGGVGYGGCEPRIECKERAKLTWPS